MYARLDKQSSTNFCFSDNVIAYYKEQIEDGIEGFAYLEGALGQEQETTSFQDFYENGRKSPYTCRNEAPPPELKDHRWQPLKPEHGYLDYGPRLFPDQADPALYYLRKDSKRVKLPVGKESWSIKGYYPNEQAYLLLPNGIGDAEKNLESWKQTNCLEGYWLYPDGNTEQICHPFSEAWGKAIMPHYPVKHGLVLTTHNISGGKRFTDAVGYLLKNKKLIKLINGQLSALSISPNGCNIAFAHARDWSDIRGGTQLKMINTCS